MPAINYTDEANDTPPIERLDHVIEEVRREVIRRHGSLDGHSTLIATCIYFALSRPAELTPCKYNGRTVLVREGIAGFTRQYRVLDPAGSDERTPGGELDPVSINTIGEEAKDVLRHIGYGDGNLSEEQIQLQTTNQEPAAQGGTLPGPIKTIGSAFVLVLMMFYVISIIL